MSANSTTELHPDAALIDSLGGPASLARKLGFEMPGGTQRVQNWKYRGIPPYTRLLRSDVFTPIPPPTDAGEAAA